MRSRPRNRKRATAIWNAVAASAAAFAAITLSSDQPVTRARAATAGSSAAAAAAAQSGAPTAAPRTTKQGAAAGSTIFIDPDTGQPREPTPDELIALSNQSAQTATAPEPFVSESGYTGLRLSDDQMMFTVATKRADGTIGVEHAVGKNSADQKVRDAKAGGLVAGKERVVER